jgi:transposase
VEVRVAMKMVHERCCGLDVHKKTVVACVLNSSGREVRTFGTVTQELLRLADWLHEERVSHVAMESTGVYWKPVYNLLEDQGIELMVVNAQHMKAVPGRKTDVKDAEWIADLLRHGLLRASFIPDRGQRELRELVRYRRRLVEQRADVVRRLQKVLEGANIKLGDVASDVMGVSGRAMLRALAEGQEDPTELSQLAKTSLRKKKVELQLALEGSVGAHQRFMLRRQLHEVEFLEGEIAAMNAEIEARMRPFEAAIAHIDAIPGLGRRSAEAIIAEIGIDMSRFPTDKHLASWARLCPGNNESAGKRRSGWTGRGNPWLRTTMVEAAWAASRNPNGYFGALYRHLVSRRGKKRAIVAVAHALLVAIYHMLKDGTAYQDLGPGHFDRIDREALIRRSVRRLERLGYQVSIKEVAA